MPAVEQMADHLTEIGVAGATWAVCTWPAAGFSPEQLAEAADEVAPSPGGLVNAWCRAVTDRGH